jgi:cell division septum initiation protein DivIVA
LAELADRLKRLRADLEVAEEQCLHFEELADDARLRALVSETPASDRQHRDAARQADTMARHRTRLREEILSLEEQQDDLLDRFYSDV